MAGSPTTPIDRLEQALFCLRQLIASCVPSPAQERLQAALDPAFTAAADLREQVHG